MSFLTVIDNLIAALKTNAALKSYCNLKWSKDLTVKFVFKEKIEIDQTEMPIILINRPVKKHGSTKSDHTVLMFFGFHQDDAEKGARELIEFDEKITDVIASFNQTEKTILCAEPEASTNDQGSNHPDYFGGIVLEIQQPIT